MLFHPSEDILLIRHRKKSVNSDTLKVYTINNISVLLRQFA